VQWKGKMQVDTYLCAMNKTWNQLTNLEELDRLLVESRTRPQLVFKHSTRCIISKMVFSKVDAQAASLAEKMDLWYLDLLAYRSISNQIAEGMNVQHQSPQTILIKYGQVIHSASHENIDVAAILTRVHS